MTYLEAIFLGVLQGLTEFLPISSSGHLVLAQAMLNVKQPGVSFELLVHIGTLFAVIIYFSARILRLIRALFVISVFAGGFGLAAYLTGVLLIPAEHETRTPTRRWFDRAVSEEDASKKLGWGLLTVAAVVVIASTGVLSAPLIVAGVLVALGVALMDRNNTKDAQ